MTYVRGIIVALVALALALHYSYPSVARHTRTHGTAHTEVSTTTAYEVERVIDGDTVVVLIGAAPVTIRLIGIDTPETVDPRKPVQCFGAEASQRAKSILESRRVFLETDPSQGDRDTYGRLLAYVFLSDGSNFNQKMIAEGYAHEYTYDLPYKYQNEFRKAERQARQKELGLWAPGVCAH